MPCCLLLSLFPAGIGVQGQVLDDNWVTSFRLTYSLDGVNWDPYTRKDFSQEKVPPRHYLPSYKPECRGTPLRDLPHLKQGSFSTGQEFQSPLQG